MKAEQVVSGISEFESFAPGRLMRIDKGTKPSSSQVRIREQLQVGRPSPAIKHQRTPVPGVFRKIYLF